MVAAFALAVQVTAHGWSSFLVEGVLAVVLAVLGFGLGRGLLAWLPPRQIILLGWLTFALLVTVAGNSWFVHRRFLIDAVALPLAGAAVCGGMTYAMATQFASRRASQLRHITIAFVGATIFLWAILHWLEHRDTGRVYDHARMLHARRIFWNWDGSSVVRLGSLPLWRRHSLSVASQLMGLKSDDLPRLAEVDCVRSLDLCDANISDADLAALTGLGHLRFVSLKRAPITDAALVHLKSLHNLQSLDVTDTRVTQAAIDDLCRALPNLTDVKR